MHSGFISGDTQKEWSQSLSLSPSFLSLFLVTHLLLSLLFADKFSACSSAYKAPPICSPTKMQTLAPQIRDYVGAAPTAQFVPNSKILGQKSDWLSYGHMSSLVLPAVSNDSTMKDSPFPRQGHDKGRMGKPLWLSSFLIVVFPTCDLIQPSGQLWAISITVMPILWLRKMRLAQGHIAITWWNQDSDLNNLAWNFSI